MSNFTNQTISMPNIKIKTVKSNDEEFNPPPVKRRQPKRKNSEDKKKETELTSTEFKSRVRQAISDVDHEELVKLLAMSVKSPKRRTAEQQHHQVRVHQAVQSPSLVEVDNRRSLR